MTPDLSSVVNGKDAIARKALLASQQVPARAEDRLRLRRAAQAEVIGLDMRRPPSPQQLEQAAHRALQREEMDLRHLAFAMVMVSNALWADALRAVPMNRRMLLLPRCLDVRTQGGLPCASMTEPCDINALRLRAQQLGYYVLVAEGMPAVLQAMARQPVEGILGLACLDSLAAVFQKVWQLGVPAVAVPLHQGGCRENAADLDWLEEFLEAHVPQAQQVPNSYLQLLHESAAIFEPARLGELLGVAIPGSGISSAVASQGSAVSGLDATGRIACDWLIAGGKRLRPFVTLAAAAATSLPQHSTQYPKASDAACRVALAIEAFHKASLVHDDIEDDDDIRYGQPTLHCKYGLPMAINVGDFLLGLGYRLIATAAKECSSGAAALLECMSRAHVLLAQGQGAELTWRRTGQLAPAPREVLRVYALKTAPAFEAALGSGMLLGASSLPAKRQDDLLCRYARHVGVAFQILNDLDDWGEDVAAGRPTYLSAYAVAVAPDEHRESLLEQFRAVSRKRAETSALPALRCRLEELGVFTHAGELVEALRQRAIQEADQFTPLPLAALCRFLVGLILERTERPCAG